MKHLTIFILLTYAISGKTQMNDNIWLVYQTETKTSQIDFRAIPPAISVSQKLPFHGVIAIFSDDEGNLLYYTNGIVLNN
jgi:hypothetical protein